MLPGVCGLGSRGLTLGVAISTIFYSANPETGQDTVNATIPAGFTSARVTIFGHGGAGGQITYDDGTAFWYGGGGGAMSQSVLAVVPGQACSMRFGSGYDGASFNYTDFYIQNSLKVRAQNGVGMENGKAYYGNGQVKYSGGYGGRTESRGSADSVTGAGAAGTAGDGAGGGYFYSTTGGTRGTGQSFTASNGAVAINADGAGSRSSGYGAGKNYGGGGAFNNDGGVGIVIVEWGFGQ